MKDEKSRVDHYIGMRERIRQLEKDVRDLVADLDEGRHEGTIKDLRVSIVRTHAAMKWTKAGERRTVAIVDKLKPKPIKEQV